MNRFAAAAGAVVLVTATAVVAPILLNPSGQAQTPTPLTFEQADVSHNGAVTLADVLLVLAQVGKTGYNPCFALLKVPLDGSVPTEWSGIPQLNDYGTEIPYTQMAGQSGIPVQPQSAWHTNPAGVPLLACPLDWFMTPEPTDTATPTATGTP